MLIKMSYERFLIIIICILLRSTESLLPLPFKDTRHRPVLHSERFKPSEFDIEHAIGSAKRQTDVLQGFESTIQWPTRIELGTPGHGLYLQFEPSWKAMERGRQALLALKSSEQLAFNCVHNTGMSLEVCSRSLSRVSFYRTSLSNVCEYLQRNCSLEEHLNIYRTIDGTCNNIFQDSRGESFTAYERYLDAQYLNLYNTPKRSINRLSMPSPRRISTAFMFDEENSSSMLSIGFVLFGQFIEHDLSSFASSVMLHFNDSFSCCDISGFDIAPRYKHPLCMSIAVSSGDYYYAKKRIECISYIRSLPAMKSDCTVGPLQQQNQATHYLDGSQIYGVTNEKSYELRLNEQGKLKFIDNVFPPLAEDPQQQCQVDSQMDICFASGDARVNLHPQLTAMYTLWIREHNRVAEELSNINPNWDDEVLFQEARRIVIAEIQHLTYNEWLKYLLESKHMDLLKKFSKYREHTDPTVSNSFAAAAIRSLDSMYTGNISILDEDRNQTAVLKMSEYFNKPEIVTKEDMFDSIVRGFTTDPAQQIGRHYSKDLINKFLADENFGYDILSIDIQRGRDHGLPGYNAYRHLCGLPKADTFNDFLDFIPIDDIRVISSQYLHVDDVDLLVGGLLEKPLRHSVMGPTFSCLIGDQLMRTKRGDRYFYSNLNQPKPFTTAQILEIEKVTFARIICDNSGITTIQLNAFERLNDSLELVDCTSDLIPKMDLNFWKDANETNT